MIPSVVARQVRQGITDFLQTTFPVTTSRFAGALDRFLAREDSIFKGPFISIQLPFRNGHRRDHFAAIELPFTPYLHQEKAFARIGQPRPASTIIATGTGSGKTESFLLPVLDYCWQHRGEPGIKAVLIYPMNALATDQACRLAETVHACPKLRGNVTAGLYVGQEDETPSAVMGEHKIITDKKLLRKNPPDILITNYKMLDYLLLRIKDQAIWKNNGPETLKFLVVDELHTFDGAQGSDLACLIRRLKARLGTPKDHLCCVGTSATLGNDEEGAVLLKYAGEVFGENFATDAIISEYRLSAGEFLESHFINRTIIPTPDKIDRLAPENWSSHSEYIRVQHELWFDEPLHESDYDRNEWRLALPQKLLQHSFFQNLLKLLRGKPRSYHEIAGELEKFTPEFNNSSKQYKNSLIDSLLALVSVARNGNTAKPSPFLHIRYQLWFRELTRMTGAVAPIPEIAFADDLGQDQLATHLPLIHCRECNKMGWAGLKRQFDEQVNGELRSFYSAFFKADPEVAFFFPESDTSSALEKTGSYLFLCTSCLSLNKNTEAQRCFKCDNHELVKVYHPETVFVQNGRRVSSTNCPFCNGHRSLTILGSRAASLTSVAISQIYASDFNSDKKLLTFSDSVQDAAHRAGFFAGRTYTFNFRIAVQKFIQTLAESIDLAAMPARFIDFWLERLGPERFITTFIGPNMTWLREFEHLIASGRADSGNGLLELVKKRVHWQILSEYGFRARIGRTLEKAGLSMAVVDEKLFENAVSTAVLTLKNEVEMLRNLNEEKVKFLISGLLMHLKNLGGIYYSELENLVSSWGETYLLNRFSWTPDFSPKARTPAFLTTRRTNRFELLSRSGGGRHTWCEVWLEKIFGYDNELIAGMAPQVYEVVLQAMVKEEILIEFKQKGDRIWGIRPEALQIEQQLCRLACNKCSRQISVGEKELPIWLQAPCVEITCGGFFHKAQHSADYYAKLYANGDVERIFAAEHTGLLERNAREDLERRFKNSNDLPGAPNLLSCTPTLELGINIGELSTVILCSVPPAQANYLQRIGRAGRQNGNSLNLTVANSRPHDLYFFADPADMIAGKVEPPGIFLNASAVLERQLTAFCFDCWAASGPKESAMPVNLHKTLSNIGQPDKGRFPYNLLEFIRLNQSNLFNAFVEMFSGVITDESKEHLKNFMAGNQSNDGSLEYRIINRLLLQSRTIEGLRSRIKTLVGKINLKKEQLVKDANYHAELEELMMEKKGLNDLVQDLGSKHTLNFFTDEGLLPNYAFPEAGVTLRSVIFRKKAKTDENGNYETLRFEYERPAVAAISELAPSATFYAGGRKVTIDQVDLSVSDIENWQMCDNCSYMTREISRQIAAGCPACGSSQWGNISQKRQMLRLTQVFSTSHDRDSRLNDDSDERDTVFFNRQMVVELHDAERIAAFKVDSDELPFGFEFYTKAGFRDINFGERDSQAEKFRVNGTEMTRRGFVICRYCGKVQNAKGEIKHSLSCVSRKKDSVGNLTNCVYLYREFHSEAIMMLMPFVTGTSGKELHSFIAAVNLGLKRKFGGNIGHLQLTLHDEPIPDTAQRKQFLVLYDTVPGGTGYLKQLMRSTEPMMEVFELALAVLKSCECNRQNGSENNDGCYRCLFAYKQSYNMAGTSRNTAIELLSSILTYRDRLVGVKSLEEVSVSALLDSNLEAGFIEILRRCNNQLGLPVMLKMDVINNKPGYYLKIGDRAWQIEPQVPLGEQYGINPQVQSKADFVFYPVKGCKNAHPLVVFTDGFGFHWNRTDKDFAQRDAILKTGRFNLWLLSYNDVESYLGAARLSDYCKNLMDNGQPEIQTKFRKLMMSYKVDSLPNPAEKDSFAMLLNWMLETDERRWRFNAFAMALVLLDHKKFQSETDILHWKNHLETICPAEVNEAFKEAFDQNENDTWRYGLQRFDFGNSSIELMLCASDRSIRNADFEGIFIACSLDDKHAAADDHEYRKHWNGFLKLLNVLQFLPNAFFFTARGRLFPYQKPVTGQRAVSDSRPFSNEWQELLDVAEPAFVNLIEEIARRELPMPIIDAELRSHDGRLICNEMAALAWPEQKFAIPSQNRHDWFKYFIEEGWQVISLDEIGEEFNKVEIFLKAKE